jgi:hypothetical protein
MIPKIWRLSENSGDDNLGLACTEQGLMLGRTALIAAQRQLCGAGAK